MKRLIALLLTLLMVISCFAACSDPDAEEIDWVNIRLSDVLPEPQSNMMEILTNDDDWLSVYIHEMSENDFLEYVRWCEDDKDFSIDIESYGSSFYAYNQEGYYLSLYYDDTEETMHISLEAPMVLTEYTLPEYAITAGLPLPESVLGSFNWENDDSFFLYVGNTTQEEYMAYMDACIAAGFTVEPYKYDTVYSAQNAEGFEVSLNFKGFNTFTLEFSCPDDYESTDESTSSDSLLALPSSDYDYLWTDYQDIVKDFTDAGFTNVKAVPLGDMTEDDWLISEGEYDTITVAGSESFEEGDLHPTDVEIIITYHSYAENAGEDPTDASTSDQTEAPPITVTMDEDELKGMDYSEAEKLLREMGFTVFRYDTLDAGDRADLHNKIGAVEIKSWEFGNGDFEKGDTYETDAIVVLWYYEYEEVIVIPNLTAENCPDLAALLELRDPSDPSVATFANQYSGQTIEFDGCITAMQNHEDYKTRYDVLIGAGDFDANSMRGPNFRLTDVSYYDMNVTGGDSVYVGLNVHVVARVGKYNANTSLFELDTISVEIR